MKIAHVCLSLGKGGAEKLLVDNLPHYVQKGHDITIIQFSSILEEPSYIETIKKAQIKLLTLSKGGFRNPLIIFELIKVLKREGFDIVHVHLFPCLYFVPLAVKFLKRKPILVFTEHSSENGRRGNFLLQLIEPFIYDSYQRIIAISENIELTLRNLIPKLSAKIEIIHNGVDLEKFTTADSYDFLYFKENYQLDPNTIKVFMTSRFSYPKDQETVVNAMKLLPESFHAFFIGDGINLEKTKNLAIEIGVSKRVHFLGFRADIPELMKSADINVLSSLYEGMSGVVLEGLASSRPFLGADVPGINDVVPNKDFLFEKGSYKNLADKILEVMNSEHLISKMKEEGEEYVKRFDAQKSIDKHLHTYKVLLDRQKSSKNV